MASTLKNMAYVFVKTKQNRLFCKLAKNDFTRKKINPETVDISLPSTSISKIEDIPLTLNTKTANKMAFRFLLSGLDLDKPLSQTKNKASFEKKSLPEMLDSFKQLLSEDKLLDAEKVNEFLNKAANENKFALVRDFIYFLGINGFNPNQKHYYYLVRALCNAKEIENAKSVIDSIKANGQPLSAEIYCEMAYLYLKERNIVKAWKWYHKIMRDGIPLNEKTLLCALKICAKEQNPRKALNILEQYEISGIRPTLRTFNAAILACASGDSKFDSGASKAFDLFKRMCKSKIKPNVESYNSLLLATSQMGNLDVTIAVLELMDKHGIAKNFYSYQRMIQCIRKTLKTPNLSLEGRDTTKQERIDMAVQLFSEMNDKDLCDDRRKAEIITKEIFLVYQNSFALKRCLAFVENLNEDDNAELYQELCLRAFRKTLNCRKVEYCFEYLKKIKKLSLKEYELKYLMFAMGKREDKILNKNILSELNRLNVKISKIDSEYASLEMKLEDRLIYEQILLEDLLKLKHQIQLGGLKLPKNKKKRNWMLRKANVIKPIEGNR